MTFQPFAPELILDAAFSPADVARVMEVIAPIRNDHLWRKPVQEELRARLLTALPHLEGLGTAIENCLCRAPHCCVLRGMGFEAVAEADQGNYVAVLSLLLGDLSQSNVADHTSGKVVETVRPLDPESRDVTYTLGACEPHADESSKPRPEDIACLWCVRPARWGGATVVWPAAQLIQTLARMPAGEALLRTLRTRRFPFGGRLRQPPRVLLAPILFGTDGIRFRLGTIQDAFAVLGQEPDAEQVNALRALIEAVRLTVPFGQQLARGETLLVLNRRVLHAREDFDDLDRLLIRTRLYNARLSSTPADRDVSWQDGEAALT